MLNLIIYWLFMFKLSHDLSKCTGSNAFLKRFFKDKIKKDHMFG